MAIDEFSAQRYTVFAAFVNLYLKTGHIFYKECAGIFCYSDRYKTGAGYCPTSSAQVRRASVS